MAKTLEQFSQELDAAFASVSEEDLKRLLKNWGNKESFKIRLKNQFASWPDVLKDKVEIDVKIKNGCSRHRFLSFKNVNLEGVNLEGVNLEYADLEEACLNRANLKSACLLRVNMKNTDMENVLLDGAVLQAAHMERANLERASLKGANLKFAHMERAYLRDADLEDADLEDADLEDADLEGARLEGAKGLVDRYQNRHITLGARTMRVTINRETILPDELLCSYFNSELYPKKEGFIENPTTAAEWVQNFVALYQDSSRRIVTPPQSRLNLEVSGDINAWVLAMLPRLEEAWNKREQDPTRLRIQQVLTGLQGRG